MRQSPQAINWTNLGLLLIGPTGIHFSELWIKQNDFRSTNVTSECRLQHGGHLYRLQSMYWFAKWRHFSRDLATISYVHVDERHRNDQVPPYTYIGSAVESLTRWGRDKIGAILQTTSQINDMKIVVFWIKIQWKLNKWLLTLLT